MIILGAESTATAPTYARFDPTFLLGLFVIGLIVVVIIAMKRSTGKKAAQRVKQKEDAKGDVVDRLEALNDLLEKGIITQEEFDAKKKQLLGL